MEDSVKSLLPLSYTDANCAQNKNNNQGAHRKYWFRDPPEDVVFTFSYIMGLSLWQLPMEYVDGSYIPTVIFHGRHRTFHVFVLSLCAAFCGSFGAIELRQRNPKLAKYYRNFAVGSMTVAWAAFLWAAVQAGFMWVASLFLCQGSVWS